MPFNLTSAYTPQGDQPQAIKKLSAGVHEGKKHQVQIGDYVFDKTSFQALIGYVWMGGMPRWKDNIRPDCVLSLKTKIEQSKSILLKGLILR